VLQATCNFRRIDGWSRESSIHVGHFFIYWLHHVHCKQFQRDAAKITAVEPNENNDHCSWRSKLNEVYYKKFFLKKSTCLQDCDQELKFADCTPKSYGTLKETTNEIEIENNEPILEPVIYYYKFIIILSIVNRNTVRHIQL